MKHKDINEHPLLTEDQKKLARAMLKHDRAKTPADPYREPPRVEFNMLEFAKIALRAEAREYVEGRAGEVGDHLLRHAALLYAHEALAGLGGTAQARSLIEFLSKVLP